MLVPHGGKVPNLMSAGERLGQQERGHIRIRLKGEKRNILSEFCLDPAAKKIY